MLDEAERKKFRCAIRREGSVCTKMSESDTRVRENEEGSQMSQRSGKSDVGDVGMEARRDEG